MLYVTEPHKDINHLHFFTLDTASFFAENTNEKVRKFWKIRRQTIMVEYFL